MQLQLSRCSKKIILRTYTPSPLSLPTLKLPPLSSLAPPPSLPPPTPPPLIHQGFIQQNNNICLHPCTNTSVIAKPAVPFVGTPTATASDHMLTSSAISPTHPSRYRLCSASAVHWRDQQPGPRIMFRIDLHQAHLTRPTGCWAFSIIFVEPGYPSSSASAARQ